MVFPLWRFQVLIVVFSLSAVCMGQSIPPDPGTVHDRVESRGIGKSIKVRETNGKTVTGTITSIEADSFQLQPKHGAQAVRIRNDEVLKAEGGGLPRGVKITIFVFVGLVLLGAIAGTRV